LTYFGSSKNHFKGEAIPSNKIYETPSKKATILNIFNNENIWYFYLATKIPYAIGFYLVFNNFFNHYNIVSFITKFNDIESRRNSLRIYRNCSAIFSNCIRYHLFSIYTVKLNS